MARDILEAIREDVDIFEQVQPLGSTPVWRPDEALLSLEDDAMGEEKWRRHGTYRVPSDSATFHLRLTTRTYPRWYPNAAMNVISWRRPLLIASAAVSSVSLQGCSMEVPRHTVGYWQDQESYLETYKADVPPPPPPPLNPCSVESPRYLQCGGHGECKPWLADPNVDNATVVAASLKFCHCEEAWADPNCETPRKSQQVASWTEISQVMTLQAEAAANQHRVFSGYGSTLN
eukprot:Skav208074  [mRNA]  locus=scaffold2107:147433:173133:- [translate_table: standard]